MAIDLLPEMIVGDYRLLEEAGAGGFSVVWRAEALRTAGETAWSAGGATPRPQVALKFPRVERFVEHLRQEASLAGAALDPQVVPILSAHLEHDPPFLVMPWIEGRPLKPPSALKPSRISEGLKRGADLAAILGRLHARGVSHGDIKPGNLRLGRDGRLQLLDLGLARLQVESNLERSLAQSLVSVDGRSLAGTLDYMAPELFEGGEPGPASDVYALGVLLHELITGRPPAFGVSPREVNPDLPPGSEALLRALLHPAPNERLTDLGVVGELLARLIEAERRCLKRRNGHARRRVFQRRLETLRGGLRGLLLAAGIVLLAALIRYFAALPGTFTGGAIEVALILGTTVFLPTGLLLGITTVNAWILGVPEGLYKKRPGHPLWSFMMQ